ncbi:MAG TPA: phosphatidylserine decarboxylase [Terriglobia bacterium]|nr:phosphatidylserine decarboxylase [Terriglobia bacterium]
MVKDGYWYGLPLVLIAGGLTGLWLHTHGFFLLVLTIFFAVLSLLVLNFFRDPERIVPAGQDAIVSPADGLIVQLAEEEFEGRPVRRLSIFMSPLDVHVNRAPIAGSIQAISYKKGSFRVASKDLASIENEQNIFTIEGEQGVIVVKQIAGLLARRIVFWKRLGDSLARGERVGMIKFGSRVDVLVTPTVQWCVKVGDRVRAGSSILGSSTPQSS